MDQNCRSCHFFREYETSLKQGGYGACRRNPPTVRPKNEIGYTVLDMTISFPYTHGGQYCGEWVPNNDYITEYNRGK